MRGGAKPRHDPVAVPDASVRSQLDRILASEIFKRTDRLSSFLRFVTEQTLDGQGAGLKEHALALQLYGKDSQFDGASDPIVRVDARRLRDKLREYYAEFPQDAVLITLPKGSYVPVFMQTAARTDENAGPTMAAPPALRDSRWPISIAVACALAVVIGAIMFWRITQRPDGSALPRNIAPFPGHKAGPTLSPTGDLVAFSSPGPEDAQTADIWVKAVDAEGLRRLTQTPQFDESSPAWSPDGREIAFVREGQGVFIVPREGGPERKVAATGTHVGWVPDGKSVLVRDNEGDGPYCLFQVVLENGERRRLTNPNAGVGDWKFSASPDGSSLAFIRYEHPGVADLFVVSMQGGIPRRLTNWKSGQMDGVAWMPNGKELIYSNGQLWRIGASVTEPGHGTLLAGISGPASDPSISRPKAGELARLVFLHSANLSTFRRIDLSAPLYQKTLQGVAPFVASTEFNYSGPFSPDGTKFMFVSGLPLKLAYSNIEGSQRHDVVTMAASQMSPGSWSPDGDQFVYDAAVDGNNDIYAVKIGGGQPRRLTEDSSIDGVASWSRDGQWIYFTSTRAGAVPDIWKIPAEGGQAVRVTFHGGIYSQQSSDGRYLYYADRPRDGDVGTAKLMQVPATGGQETEIFGGLTTFWWSAARSGIYYIVRESEYDAIDRYNFSDRRIVRVGRLASRAGPIGSKLNVSQDERWALVPQQSQRTELMLLDGVR